MDKIISNFEILNFDEFYNNSWFTSNLIILYSICKEDNLLNIENLYKTVNLNNVMSKNVDTLKLLNNFIINVGKDIEDLRILNKETKKYKYVKNTYSIYGNEERVITNCGYKVCFYIVYIILKHLLNKDEFKENIKKDEFIELELNFKPLIEEIYENERLHTNDPKNKNRKKIQEEEEKIKEILNQEEKNKNGNLLELNKQKNQIETNEIVKGCSCEKLSISSDINNKKKERNQMLKNKLEEEEKQKIIERIELKEKIKLNEELSKGNTNRFINNNNYIINISKPKKIKVPLYKLYLIYAQISGIMQKSEIRINNIDSFYSLFFWEPLKDILYKKIKFLELVENIIPENKKNNSKKNNNTNNNNNNIYKLLKHNNKKNIKTKYIKTKYILIKKNIEDDNSIISFLKDKFNTYTLFAVLQRDNKNIYSVYFNKNKNKDWFPPYLNSNILYLFEKTLESNLAPTPSAPPINNKSISI